MAAALKTIFRDLGALALKSVRTRNLVRGRNPAMTWENVHYDSCPFGHNKIESTVRYLGIEIDDAIKIAVKVDI
jgi:hypothetical protein